MPLPSANASVTGKKRVAAGSGTKVEEINRLLKMHIQMAGMMKQMGQGKGMFGKMFGAKGAPDAAELEKMQAELAGLDPVAQRYFAAHPHAAGT